MADPRQLPPEVEELILQLAQRSQEIQREDSETLVNNRNRSRVGLVREVIGVAVVCVGIVGFGFTLKVDSDQAKEKLAELRDQVKENETEIRSLKTEVNDLRYRVGGWKPTP